MDRADSKLQSKIFSGSMELSTMKKVELVSGISKDLIPLTLPDLTNKAKDAQELQIKEETGGEESQKKSMVNAGTRIKMGSITPEKLANLDTTAIGS